MSSDKNSFFERSDKSDNSDEIKGFIEEAEKIERYRKRTEGQI